MPNEETGLTAKTRKDTRHVTRIMALVGDEREAVLQEMLQIRASKRRVEDAKKVAMADFKKQLDAHEAKVDELCDALGRGMRKELDIDIVIDYGQEPGQVYEYVHGTNELINQRELREDERQMEFTDVVDQQEIEGTPVDGDTELDEDAEHDVPEEPEEEEGGEEDEESPEPKLMEETDEEEDGPVDGEPGDTD